ncbi:Sugar transferase involved in LPS biosynthesis (colanic, teichoic acid) [Salipiger thiooxidans]|uniref:Sugar transferase involved in LPS biosynthesis (Colanic, teichoic acid) n=1 Tax=Salipiger thiooxidans TaxID=282683 RepID=A0A1G7LLV6_9RHOB|nr:Sugar transferase involved in LPS biosynthesis (colanic, teichoic acid) [Salipiger thiooxidans]
MLDAGSTLGDTPAFSQRMAYRREAQKFYARYTKRIVDIGLALILLPVLVPVIATLWAMTRTDGGPGFFGHRRIGKNGKVFRCWKIRTMVPNAEERLVAYLANNPAAAEEWARDHKLTDDPRITKIGRFLRETSLDELPQIWNVLMGEMSFVGPRPVVRAEMKKYGHGRTAYLTMKPGITGLWQVSGRNDVSYDERVAMDIEYLQTVSLKTDLQLIAKTAGSVLNRTGR